MMEPNRYWFLYLGLLFLFLSSRVGQAICLRVYGILRFCFYMTLALVAGLLALFFQGVSILILRFADFLRRKKNPRIAQNAEE